MINDIKDLEKLLKLCRKQGIEHLKMGELDIKFGELPSRADPRTADDEDIPTDEPTPEQMAFYAVRGVP